MAFVLVLCGLFWGAAQLACSQFLGASGDAYADRIWREQVRKRTAEMRVLDNVWFTDKAWIVSLDTLRQDGEGTGFVAYRLSDDGLRFSAPSCAAPASTPTRARGWCGTPCAFLPTRL